MAYPSRGLLIFASLIIVSRSQIANGTYSETAVKSA